jgi:hypothetical protein
MADARPTWALVLEAANQLAERVGSPFTLSDLIAEVQRRDPARGRGTISPVVEGMTANAGAMASQAEELLPRRTKR